MSLSGLLNHIVHEVQFSTGVLFHLLQSLVVLLRCRRLPRDLLSEEAGYSFCIVRLLGEVQSSADEFVQPLNGSRLAHHGLDLLVERDLLFRSVLVRVVEVLLLDDRLALV